MEPQTRNVSDVDAKVEKVRTNKASVATQQAVQVEMQDYMPHAADSAKKVDGVA